jgi:hypothetical protein
VGVADEGRQFRQLVRSENVQLIGECRMGGFLGGPPPALQVRHGRRALLQLGDRAFFPGGAAQPGWPATRIDQDSKGDLKAVAPKGREVQPAAQFSEHD